jgi:glycolate oxidase FAD binding subunit
MTTPPAILAVDPRGPLRLDATRVGDVVDAVREAAAQRRPLRIVGGGSWLHAGRPVTAHRMLDLSRLRGIVDYVPGDLTLTALAGTPLAEIDAATRSQGQWLPLDPFGTPRGTLGATLATASAGPLAASVGLPRDVALGIAFVTGEGRLVRGGGRVVKNVAGFDLVRLTVGAWGTLGVIVEATVRLRARPELDETVALSVPGDAVTLAGLLRAVRASSTAPLAAELVSAPLATRLAVPGDAEGDRLVVRLAGNEESVRAQRAELARLGALEPVPATIWSALRGAEPESLADRVVARVSRRPSELARLWTATAAADAAGGARHATMERGIVRAWLPATDQAAMGRVLDALDPADARVFEVLPSEWWGRFAPPADPLGRAIREAFDPARVLNRGALGGDEAS